MQKIPNQAALIQLANSAQGQQLLAYLKQHGGTALNTAIDQAAKGNFQDAQKALSSLLASPEAKKLLKQLEGSNE